MPKETKKSKKTKGSESSKKGKSKSSKRSRSSRSKSTKSSAKPPAPGPIVTTLTCINHKDSPLEFFCETCQEVVCLNCMKAGPHNSHFHKISSIQESFDFKFLEIKNIIEKILLLKKDKLKAQICRIEYRLNELGDVKSIIERDIRSEFKSISARVDDKSGQKVSTVAFRLQQLQDKLSKTENISLLFSKVHDNLNSPDDLSMNRAAIFLQLLEINKKVQQLFDQTDVGFGEQLELPPLPAKAHPEKGKLPNMAQPTGEYKEGPFGRFRDRIAGLNPPQKMQRFMDMNDVVDMQSDKDLPDFLHKLNLRLNLYEPDLKFATIHKKLEKLTKCGIPKLRQLLQLEQEKNDQIQGALDGVVVPREVQGIHHTQEEINTLTAILTLRETQWRQIQVVMETQKDKQKEINEKCVISELQEWINLAENYAKEIEQFDLICFFCAQPFEEDLVNQDCELNRVSRCLSSKRSRRRVSDAVNTESSRMAGRLSKAVEKEGGREEEWEGFTETRPPDVFYGNHRHFWARAKENLFTCQLEKKRILKRLSQDNIDTLLLKKKKKSIGEILYKIKRTLASQNRQFQEIFEEHDHNRNGIVSCYTFSYLLESIFELNPNEVSLLIQLVNGDEFDDVPYLSLTELLENTDRVNELPLFIIHETDESLQTPILSRRVSSSLHSENPKPRNGRTIIEGRSQDPTGRSNQTSFRKVSSHPSKENFSDSLHKITSIGQQASGSIEGKTSPNTPAIVDNPQGQLAPSKKSHFSPEHHNIVDNFSEGEHLEGAHHLKDHQPEELNLEEKFVEQNLREEMTRQSLQIKEMADIQKQILETLKRQSQQMARPVQPQLQKKSQFQMFEGQSKGNEGGAVQGDPDERESRNMIMDSTHFNLGRSHATGDDQNNLDPRNYSVFNIFQKRNTTSTQQEQNDGFFNNFQERNIYIPGGMSGNQRGQFLTVDVPENRGNRNRDNYSLGALDSDFRKSRQQFRK